MVKIAGAPPPPQISQPGSTTELNQKGLAVKLCLYAMYAKVALKAGKLITFIFFDADAEKTGEEWRLAHLLKKVQGKVDVCRQFLWIRYFHQLLPTVGHHLVGGNTCILNMLRWKRFFSFKFLRLCSTKDRLDF